MQARVAVPLILADETISSIFDLMTQMTQTPIASWSKVVREPNRFLSMT